ncbi:MAG: family 78 glycoside hydrolase catalytic domain [Candidatus Acidiferrales bacterium]
MGTRRQRRVVKFFAIGLVLGIVPAARSSPAKANTSQSIAVRRAPLGTIRITLLRCEQLENPLGIETRRPLLSWQLEALGSERRGLRQTSYRILVASSASLLAKDVGDMWDSGKAASNRTIQIEYFGKELKSNGIYYWKVRVWDQDGVASVWSDAAQWQMGLLEPADWKAKWIAAEPDSESAASAAKDLTNAPPPRPLPIFRHGFNLAKPVERAVVYVSGLGQYELRMNGTKVSEDLLTPGWTNYRKAVLCNVYDVTSLIKSGENAIGIMLGNGMYNVPRTPGRYQKFVGTFGQPKLIFQMHVRYLDGTEAVILSDSSWKTAPGPITFSSEYGGEDYDARLEQAGWDEPGFNDAAWTPAVEVNGPGGRLSTQLIPPIRVMHVYPVVAQTKPEPGILVFDLGQNFSGWPAIKVSGHSGDKVKLLPGELLDSSGLVSQRSSGGPSYFVYTLKGSGQETWHPRFSYYGFRYVQVEGATLKPGGDDGKPVLLSLEGQFVHSSARVTGDFSSSDELLDRIHGLIDAAMRSNMQSVMTDCPHREKLGWLEETQLLGSALMYNFDLSQLYRKISDDIADTQLPNGLVPDTAPEYVVFPAGFRDSPEWGSAAILDPWLEYRFYGDRRLLAQRYDVMRKYAEYLATRADDHIISYGLGDWYDVGPGPLGESQLTSRGVTATSIYYLDLTVLHKVSLLLGKDVDAQKYAALARAVRVAFNAKMFNPQTNEYDTGSQTANAMPLAAGLVPDDRREAVLDNLVQDIRNHDNHVTAGDVGFHFVVQALEEGGRSDVLYDMLSRTDSPSYGYQLARGATTLTEAWDTNPTKSQDHFMLGDAEEWFYSGLAGIDFDLSRPPGEQIEIHPTVVGDIASAQAGFDSALGLIESRWECRARLPLEVGGEKYGECTLDVTVPVGAEAEVRIPSPTAATITESGKALDHAIGVKLVRSEKDAVICRIESGKYYFEWKK